MPDTFLCWYKGCRTYSEGDYCPRHRVPCRVCGAKPSDAGYCAQHTRTCLCRACLNPAVVTCTVCGLSVCLAHVAKCWFCRRMFCTEHLINRHPPLCATCEGRFGGILVLMMLGLVTLLGLVSLLTHLGR